VFALVSAVAVAADNAERALPTGPFHAVVLAAKATVQVKQANAASVVVTGDSRLVRCVTANVRDGRLVIAWAGKGVMDRDDASGKTRATGDDIVVTAHPECQHEGDPHRLVIRIAAPQIDAVTIREQGFVQVFPMRIPTFAASIFGRGSITLDGLHAGTTRLSISGSGRITATGELGRLDIAVPGSGVIDTRAAHAGAIDLAIGGHGDIAATTDGLASGTFGGRGSIVIGGHPTCSIHKLGSGRIICPAAPRKEG
jgi:hypothetical protein